MLSVLVVLLFGWLVSAVAVKQASYILIHGSIFESLRNWIEDGMHREWFGFEKLRELFTCQLCMTTQVSIWLVAIPLLLSGRVPAVGFVETVAGFAVTVFAVSGLAIWFWNLSESGPKRLEADRKRYDQIIISLRKEISSGAPPEQTSAPSSYMDREMFGRLLDHIESACKGHGCGYSRRDCRREEARQFTVNQMRLGMLAQRFGVEVLLGALDETLPEYFRLRWRNKSSSSHLNSFRDKVFARLTAITTP
ncbi:MAG: hypothetical protein AB200_00450 [Parcubacteria bacterium C7867-005]|nr:MAG: hypothetical protein AB200_00450 [Parcubacteria bacterium C7867-005]